MAEIFVSLKRLTGTGGLYRKLDPAAPVDGVWSFTDNDGSKLEFLDKLGPYKTKYRKILPGSDMTTTLQTVVNAASVYELIFDNGDITIDGTLTIPAGKRIILLNNARLVGNGTVNGGIYVADKRKQIFGSSITINPEGTENDKMSVIWFGADPTGVADSATAIQKTIDTVVRNNSKISTVYLPVGNYICNKGLVIYNRPTANYAFHTVNFVGEGSWWQSSTGGTKITFSNKQSFGLAAHLMKGGSFKGLKIVGPFTVPTLTDRQFFNTALADYNDGTVIKTAYAGLFGLVIDPFVNNDGNKPATGTWATQGYPDFTSFYEGGGGSANSGSTGVVFEDLFFSGWDACICFSPTGFTRNAELMYGRRIQIEGCRIGICNTQDQEKTNVFQHIAGWADIHTIFAKFTWGAGTPGVYSVSDVNIAGRVNQFIDHVEGGYFASHFNRIFTERMGKFGRLQSLKGASVSDSEIGFCNPEESKWQQRNIDASGVTFKNCTIRYYGSFAPVTLYGQSTYDGCSFEVTPYFGTWGELGQGSSKIPVFINCFVDSSTGDGGWSGSMGMQSSNIMLQGANKYISPFGKKKITHGLNAGFIEYSHDLDYSLPYAEISCGNKSATKVLNGAIEEIVLTISGNEKWLWGVGQNLAVYADGVGYVGNVHSISDTQVVIRHPVQEWVDSTRAFYVMHPIWHHHFSGAVTQGSNVISNVILGHKWLSMANMVGMVIEAKSGVNDSAYSRWNIIIAQDGTNFTCLSNFYYTSDDCVFSTAKEVTVDIKNANVDYSTHLDFRMIRGDRWISSRIADLGRKVFERVIKSGATITAARFKPENTTSLAYRAITSNTTVSFDDEEILVNTTSGNVTITIPEKATFSGTAGYHSGKYSKTFRIVKTSSDVNKVIINAYAGENISGLSTIEISRQYDSAHIEITDSGNFLLNPPVNNVRIVDDADFTFGASDVTIILVNATTLKTATVPGPTLNLNRIIEIVNTGTGTITTSINYRKTPSITANVIQADETMKLQSNGTDWWLISKTTAR